MKRNDIQGLYYITHIENVSSILKYGILSHERLEQDAISTKTVYDKQIVINRQSRTTPDGHSLWRFANLYFQPCNPMLYRVLHEGHTGNIVILQIRPDILEREGAFISTGNAASQDSAILPAQDGLKAIFQMWDIIKNEWWNGEDGSKRKIMAECLVPDLVDPELIQTIYVPSSDVADKLKQVVQKSGILIVPEPQMFFRAIQTIKLTPKLSLVEGDMFFSQAQTLTISVNVVSVMGKGLASRAKYQFPDVYVVYQDMCQKKILQMGRPYLYKREAPLDYDLADQPLTLTHINDNKWFLLFPTKQHWRNRSDIHGIERGLAWIRDNYQAEGITSLAIPALGCGLGGLEWKDVGPLMCQYLSDLDIPVRIYLPRERDITEEQLSQDFLIRTE